ncbi:cyclohexanecarboxylate-CoA ligase, partial [Mycobacterium sp. ITM-2017-0098]
PPSLIHRAADYFEHAIVTRVYGSTEVPVTTVGSLDDVDRAADEGDLGDPRSAVGVGGEIRARGPQMLTGYLRADDTRDAFDEAGYFRTGDLGRWTD